MRQLAAKKMQRQSEVMGAATSLHATLYIQATWTHTSPALPSLPLHLDTQVNMAALQGMKGAVDKAVDIASRTKDAYILQQFENPANADVHRETTGPEIWRDTKGQVRVLLAFCCLCRQVKYPSPTLDMQSDARHASLDPGYLSAAFVVSHRPGWMQSRESMNMFGHPHGELPQEAHRVLQSDHDPS